MVMAQNPSSLPPKTLVQRYPFGVYVMFAYAISWSGALFVAAPYLMRNASIPKLAGLKMFPIMLLGPMLAGIVLTRAVDGKSGLQDLFSRMRCIRFPERWYLTLLIPPALVLFGLTGLTVLVSSNYSPNNFPIGIMFGFVAGFFEEIGWMGYAFPKSCLKHDAFSSGILLGLIWGVWHFPVVDHLGTATPHGSFWIPYFVAFVAAMTAMRVLIAWIYVNTKSILLAQLMHASSTGSIVIFSPPHVTAAQETLWYAVYACILWIAVAWTVTKNGVHLTNSCRKNPGHRR